jgi:hypothetical protein
LASRKKKRKKLSSLAMRLKAIPAGSSAHSAAAMSATSIPKSSETTRKMRSAVSAPRIAPGSRSAASVETRREG